MAGLERAAWAHPLMGDVRNGEPVVDDQYDHQGGGSSLEKCERLEGWAFKTR